MIHIKVLGPGCAKCDFLEERARLAVQQVQRDLPDLDAQIEKIGDLDVFLAYGLITTPGLVINDKLVLSGRIASSGTIAGWIREALSDSHETA